MSNKNNEMILFGKKASEATTTSGHIQPYGGNTEVPLVPRLATSY